MQKNQNVVEDALLQIKNLEEALQENAKGILHSTMKEEIKQLVKESLNEQDEDDLEVMAVSGDETGNEEGGDEVMPDEIDFDDSDDSDLELPIDEPDDETIDLTKADDSEVLKVFMAMDDEDKLVVTKQGNMIDVKDGEREYIIKLNESEDLMFADSDYDEFEDSDFPEDLEEELDEMSFDFMSGDKDEDNEGYIYEITMDDDDSEENDEYLYEIETDVESKDDVSILSQDLEEEDYKDRSMYDPYYGDDDEEEYYPELRISSDMPSYKTKYRYSDEENDDLPLDEEDDSEEEAILKFNKDLEDAINEAIKKSVKPKGVGIGSGPKFKYGKTTDYPTKKQKPAFSKEGVKAKGTGKARFEYDEDVNNDGYSEKPKKMETKEASRTNSYVNANKVGNRKGSNQNVNRTEIRKRPNTRVNEEVEVLKEKNEEYKRALDVFRNKLNEVAIFNSNLAYATRLFTEHSTTKQEKINILRRFDSVETLKESKNLYKTIKDELGSTTKGSEATLKESFERNVVKTPSTGSSTNLIESKTYENPQFMRMKDLMSKIK